ncbi:hypothetical protein IGJ74_001823 [Enterococcus sp. AZ009]|uniref:hypothetical protein n=1 Tax=Enterococcus TaxID=1350 RepID=UPI001C444459|nr:hypothetical protein [Enterococcus casseliflavus]
MVEKIFSDFAGEVGVVQEPILVESEVDLQSIDRETAEKLITEIQSLRKELEEYRNETSTKKS